MPNKKNLEENAFDSFNSQYINYQNRITNPTYGPATLPTIDPNEFKTPYSNKSVFTFIDHCADLRPWQQDFSNQLSNTNNDFYMLAQPGGGKTAPVVCYWVNTILGLSTKPTQFRPANTTITKEIDNLITFLTNPEKLRQIIWLAPIQALNNNLATEFSERFIDIIIQFLNRFVELDSDNNIIINSFTSKNTSIISAIREMGIKSNHMANQLSQQLINMIQIKPNNIDKFVPKNYTETFRLQLGELVKNFVNDCLVGIKQEKTDTHLIRGTNYPKPFVACIYESASSIIKNQNYDKIDLIVCDEAQRLQGSPDSDDVRRARQIANSMHEFLMNQNTKKSKIVMLTGTVHPMTAHNMMHFLNATYNRKFRPNSLIISPDKNPSQMNVLPMAGLSDKYTQLRIIKQALNSSVRGVVFIIFGKERINQLIDTIAPSESGSFSPTQNFSSSRSTSLYGKKNIKEIMQVGQDINHISDERLRRAVSNNIGFLYRQKGEMDIQHQRDSIIVQNMFISGKIKVLLCTDAIREGVNIVANTMYLPSIKKPPNNDELEPGGLAQLINRAGRQHNTMATIYTDPRYITQVINALSGNFENYKEQSFEFPFSQGADPEDPDKLSIFRKLKSKHNKVEAALNYWAGIIQGRG